MGSDTSDELSKQFSFSHIVLGCKYLLERRNNDQRQRVYLQFYCLEPVHPTNLGLPAERTGGRDS